MTRLLIGGYSGAKGKASGISVLDGDRIIATVPADSPSWLARHPLLPVLYAVAETGEGRVRAWRLADGAPADPLGTGETGGSEPAHLTVDPTGRFLITANYAGGSISVHRLGPDGSIGPRTELVQHEVHGEHPRQDGAHPHMIRCGAVRYGAAVRSSGQAIGPSGSGVSPGDTVPPRAIQLLVTDLGGDAIYAYQLSPAGKLSLTGIMVTPPGSGPRHVLQVGDRYYVTAELSGQVLSYDTDQQRAGAVPASAAPGPNQPSELVSDGRYLYVANRGPNTVTVFEIVAGGSGPSGSGVSPGDAGSGVSPGEAVPAPASTGASTDGPLRYVTEVGVGDWPRHIALAGGKLYVANERSHQVTCLTIDPYTGIPGQPLTIEVPSPTHILP